MTKILDKMNLSDLKRLYKTDASKTKGGRIWMKKVL